VTETSNPNLAAALAERAARHPERIAIVEDRSGGPVRLSYGALGRRVAALAAGLRARGLTAGDRVLLFVPMSADLYLALLAVLHAGATAVFVDAWADRRRLDAAVAAAAPAMFLATPRAHLLRLASAAVRRIPRHLIAGGWWPLARLEQGGTGDPPAIVTDDTPALITFTTGTTGRPKAAARTHGFLWAQHRVLAHHLGTREDDVDLPTLPVFVLHNLAAGATTVLPALDPRRPAEFDAAAIATQIEREHVTTSAGSPAFYARLDAWCETRGHALPLRALFTGGAPVLPRLATLLAQGRIARAAHVLYGSTEAEPIASLSAAELVHTSAESTDPLAGLCAGTPVPEIALRIVRAHDGPIELGTDGWRPWELPRGEAGEVIVRGEHVLRGYLDDPESDRANKIPDGETVWHRTGDGGRLDETGRLWLLGRVSRRVRRGGATWWGLPPELRATTLPEISHAAYVGRPDSVLGQRSLLCVELATGGLSSELRERLLAAVAPSPVDELIALAHIPRDPRHASKTDYEALARRLQQPSTS
jgi:acyl-CoA synthetase (AMP-forming)/AMP-acid ligase II